MQAVDADLLPAQLGAVGAVPVALDGLAAEPLLDGVMSSTATTQPSQPPPSAERARTAWPNGRLVGGRVVEHLDDLEVGAVGQRQDHVAGPEPRVDAAVDELLAEQAPDALRPCWPVRRVRRRRRDGPGACQAFLPAHAGGRHAGSVLLTSSDSALVRTGRRGSAGCSASAERDRTWASQCRTSSAYAVGPISSTSSGALVT